MKTKKKLIFKNVMVGFLMCALILATLGTYAWFTDKKSFSSSNLEFGTIKLNVTGDSIDGSNVNVKVARWGETQGKLMPGDDVSVKVNVALETGSDDAYYLLALTDNKGVFDDAVYYYDGTSVKTFDGTTPAVGSLKANENATHSFEIQAQIPEDYETQGGSVQVTLKVYAIQQANMGTDESTAVANAFDKLYYPMCGVSLNSVSAVRSVYDYDEQYNYWNNTGVGFYYTSQLSSLSGYTLDEAKTTTLDSKLATFDQGKNLIQVYTNGTKLAFVSDYEMFAPVSCKELFSDNMMINVLSTINFSNFNTSKVTDMGSMFYGCCAGTLDLSSFDTSKVTNMSYMFWVCSKLTTIEGLTNFNTTKVMNMSNMFSGCSVTTLNLSSFDTSNVTDMSSMFGGCSSLTTLDVSNFDTSNVTDMDCMFNTCGKLTTLNLSSFDTSKVTDMHFMFLGCSALTTLDLSSFDTSKVTDMEGVFYESSNLTTITVSDKWVINDGCDTTEMFKKCGTDHVTVV